ncbi:MAG TPA: RNA-binding protein [Bryobacteraceae bacterium]|jgi:RNA recognition motif-containing protein
MSFTVFLGNLPLWVTADDIKSWLTAENLVADNVKVIRNPETQESKGFAFIDSPNADEMNAIIRRFDRAPLEDRLLRANPAQPPKAKGDKGPIPARGPMGSSSSSAGPAGPHTGAPTGMGGSQLSERRRTAMASGPMSTQPPRDNKDRDRKKKPSGPPSAFAEELAKAL